MGYSSKEVADYVGKTPRTIRLWEKKELIPEAQRGGSGLPGRSTMYPEGTLEQAFATAMMLRPDASIRITADYLAQARKLALRIEENPDQINEIPKSFFDGSGALFEAAMNWFGWRIFAWLGKPEKTYMCARFERKVDLETLLVQPPAFSFCFSKNSEANNKATIVTVTKDNCWISENVALDDSRLEKSCFTLED